MDAREDGAAAGLPALEDLRELVRLIGGYRISQAIYVAVELGLADLLADEPKRADDLAQATGMHEESLYRVLRFLAAVGVLAELPSRRFTLTQLGTALRRDIPGSPSWNARIWLDRFQWEPWGELLHCVKTGQPAFERRHGMRLFEYLQRNPDLSQRFDEAMNANTVRDGLALAKSYDFSGIDTLADIGGGQGLLLASLLEAYPIMRGVLFDRPQVVAHAPSVLSAAGVSDRCTVIAGDFFEGVPPGASAYLLSHIVHDWADQDATRILRNCRIAGGRGGTVLVFERLIEPDSASEMSVLHIDLEMMVNVGGLERTKDQFQSVFSEAGLNLARVIPIAGTAGHVMLEGVAMG
jgi:hypothetical protein